MGLSDSDLGLIKCPDLNINAIKARIAKYHQENNQITENNSNYYQKAAVLVLLVCIEDTWNLLFTRRSDLLKNHKGQVSFPGGAMEAGDKDEVATALRETTEEIGVLPPSVHILGKMPLFITNSNFLLTPIIALLDWPINFLISEHEVSKVFTIPIPWLMNPVNWEEKIIRDPSGRLEPVIFYKKYDNELLWGISAKITVELVEHILKQK